MPSHPALTAADVKAALRGRHPHDTGNMGPGRWTCVEEWANIDLLAFDAWSEGNLIGYEVKVSRGDMRSELLKPSKRASNVAMCTQFYFAVPAGMLSTEEIAFEEPEWEAGDFDRTDCPGIPAVRPVSLDGRRAHWRDAYGGQCSKRRQMRWGLTMNENGTPIPSGASVPVPVPCTIELQPWQDSRLMYEVDRYLELMGREYATCPRCGGKGYIERSRVELEAPILWIPRDVGLVVVYETGQARVVKEAPKRKETTALLGHRFDAAPNQTKLERSHFGGLVRWISQHPDPRH